MILYQHVFFVNSLAVAGLSQFKVFISFLNTNIVKVKNCSTDIVGIWNHLIGEQWHLSWNMKSSNIFQLYSFTEALMLPTLGRWCRSCSGQRSPPSMNACWLLPLALLLTIAEPAQGISQSRLQQLDLVLLQLQPLLQVRHPVLHVHVTARRHSVIWRV